MTGSAIRREGGGADFTPKHNSMESSLHNTGSEKYLKTLSCVLNDGTLSIQLLLLVFARRVSFLI